MTGQPGRSGGRRAGKAGHAYTNRSDLNSQPIRTAPGQTYGVGAQQQRALATVPLPSVAPPPAGAVPGGGDMPQSVPLSAPTQRPGEPVTAGLPFGAGAGPEALQPIGADAGTSDPVGWLRALQSADPHNNDLADLIAHLDVPGGT